VREIIARDGNAGPTIDQSSRRLDLVAAIGRYRGSVRARQASATGKFRFQRSLGGVAHKDDPRRDPSGPDPEQRAHRPWQVSWASLALRRELIWNVPGRTRPGANRPVIKRGFKQFSRSHLVGPWNLCAVRLSEQSDGRSRLSLTEDPILVGPRFPERGPFRNWEGPPVTTLFVGMRGLSAGYRRKVFS